MNFSGKPVPRLNARQRDYIHLTAYVLAQHGHFERADALLAALEATGERGIQLLLSRAVLQYYRGAHREVLALLDRIDVADPIERFGAQDLSERQKLRRYLRACCYRELGYAAKASDAVDIYLRRFSGSDTIRSLPTETVPKSTSGDGVRS